MVHVKLHSSKCLVQHYYATLVYMAVTKTVQIGAPVLRETAREVTDVSDATVQQLIIDLRDTMRHKSLVGLAAPQIDQLLRVFVSEIRETAIRKGESSPLQVYCNPKIVHVSHETELGWEGCGSIANGQLLGEVERPREITLQYQDERGVSHETKASGLLARIMQHEIDHLDGILFTDKCDPKSLVSREYYLKYIKGA